MGLFPQSKSRNQITCSNESQGQLARVSYRGRSSYPRSERRAACGLSKGKYCCRGSWLHRLRVVQISIRQGNLLRCTAEDNATTRVVERRTVDRSKGLTSDQTVEFTGVTTSKRCPIPLPRIGYRDTTTGKHYIFLTNNFSLAASTIAAIYKSRWQIELFFKWIKQHLKIKSFMGTSRYAVMTQIWIALCVYLLIAYLKFLSRSKKSMQQILNLLQMNLFEKWCIQDLIHGRSTEKIHINPDQLSFINKLTGH